MIDRFGLAWRILWIVASIYALLSPILYLPNINTQSSLIVIVFTILAVVILRVLQFLSFLLALIFLADYW